MLAITAAGKEYLDVDFANPPDSARPGVLWQWMGGLISREGITQDLEALAAQGVGKVMVMQMPDQCPWPRQWEYRDYPGKIKVLSDGWFSIVNFAIGECDRLGIEFGMFACPGWGHLGGPWVPREMGAKKLATSVMRIEGPVDVDKVLPDLPVSNPAGTGNDIPEWSASRLKLPKLLPTMFENVAVLAVPDRGGAVQPADIIDVTRHVDADGRLKWNAPEGRWIIIRHALVSDNSINHPAPPDAMGLEVDRFDPVAVRAGIEGMIGRVRREAMAKGYRSFKVFETDSYEVGYQDFGFGFVKEFRKRRGYDCVPWLAAWHHAQTGVVVGSAEQSERFREDMSRTIAELWNERFAGTLRAIAVEYGMQWMNEPYFTLPIDWTAFGGRSVPGSEFWVGEPPTWRGGHGGNAAEIADLYGSNIAWAEAFTAESHHSAWRNDPWILKRCGDTEFANGINQFHMHGFVHNPFGDDYQPGLTMGYWGTQLGRHVTWWGLSRPWHQYLARCQHMLRQGRLGFDVLSYPQRFDVVPEPFPGIFRRARLPDELLDKLSVQDGLLTLPGGGYYEALYLTGDPIRPEALAIIRGLIHDGARVIGNIPPGRAIGLQGYPDCDAELSQMIREMWGGNSDDADRHMGKGRLVVSHSLEQGMRMLGLKPDFSYVSLEGEAKILSTYRVGDGFKAWFLVNQGSSRAMIDGSFRVGGMQPEWWDPVDGTIRNLPVQGKEEGRTMLRLGLEEGQSGFVVFRRPQGSDVPAALWGDILLAQNLVGPWNVRFARRWGGPDEPVTFSKLEDWSAHSDTRIKYYSGSATYRTKFDVPVPDQVPTHLSLGTVHNLAQIVLNGRDLGVVWCAPWRVAIPADVLREKENDLQIRVVNTWVNRLVGDEQEPDDFVTEPGNRAHDPPQPWERPGGYRSGVESRGLRDLPDWLLDRRSRPSKGRYTFSSWLFYDKQAPLQRSGLLGPVQLQTVR